MYKYFNKSISCSIIMLMFVCLHQTTNDMALNSKSLKINCKRKNVCAMTN